MRCNRDALFEVLATPRRQRSESRACV